MTEGPTATPTAAPTAAPKGDNAEKHDEQNVAAEAPATEDGSPSSELPLSSAALEASGSAALEASGETEAAEQIVEPAEPPVSEQHAVVALPGTHRQEPRPSLWRRIAMRSSSSGDAGSERVLARLDVIEARVTAAELSLGNRIQALDDRFTEVWEVEEQLSQINDLRAALAEIAAGQQRVEDRLGGINGKLTLVSVVLGAAVLAGVAAMVVAG
jgi:hypothetical protein